MARPSYNFCTVNSRILLRRIRSLPGVQKAADYSAVVVRHGNSKGNGGSGLQAAVDMSTKRRELVAFSAWISYNLGIEIQAESL